MPSSEVDKLNLFQTVDSSLQQEDKRMRRLFNKTAACINDLFMTMSNYDVRFHFDPISLDDCRCEVMSTNEVNLLCTMKEVPINSCILQGQVTDGAVMIELACDYTTRIDMASWEDVITELSPGRRYLSTTKLLHSLLDVIQRSIHEMRQAHIHREIICRSSGHQISIIVNLGLDKEFRINLLPSIQVDRCTAPLSKFDRRFRDVYKCLRLSDTPMDKICLVAKPYCADQELFWRITFNDIENRIFNTSRFQCARHCLHVLDKLCAKLSPFSGTGGHLLRYHLQTVLLAQFKIHPWSKNWTPEKFSSSLKEAVAFLSVSLRERKCINVFTDVNVLSHFNEDTLKVLARKLSKFKLDTYQLSNLLSS